MKILIVTQDMNIGGIQKSLVNLLEKLNKSNHEVILRLFNKQGMYLNQISDNVKIDDAGYLISAISKSKDELYKDKEFIKLAIKFILVIVAKLTSPNLVYKTIFKFNRDSRNYDIAVSYSQDNYTAVFSKGCNQYVSKNIKSKVKIAYLHSDIMNEISDFEDMRKKYHYMDAIINVSKSVKKNFDRVFPEYENKSYAIQNLFNEVEINKMANENINIRKDKNKLILVTVSRLSYLKGTDRILNTILKMKSIGITNYIWYVVGEGTGEFESLKLNSWAKKNKVDNNIYFVGNKLNPYPYMKSADVFIFPTRTEAFPMVTIESLILNTPVVTCRYSSVEEQVKNNFHGMIIDNDDEKFMKEICLLVSKEYNKIRKWSDNLKKYEYDNDAKFDELVKVLDNLYKNKIDL